MHCTRVEFGRVTYWSQTLRSWQRWTHLKSSQQDSTRKRWYFQVKGEFIFPIADGRIKTSGGDQELRTPTLVRHRPIQGKSNTDFLGESKGCLPPPHDSFPDASEAINEFWSMSGSFMYRHHVESRVQRWAKEKPKLQNARRLQGISFIDLMDKEFKETIRNARNNWRHQWLSLRLARQARTVSMVRNVAKPTINSKFACILEACESTRLRMEESLPKFYEDHIVGNRRQFTTTLQFGTNFSLPQAMKIPAAKAAVDKEWDKLEKILAWNLTKVRSKKEAVDEARTKGIKVHFASLMNICHLKNAQLETRHQKYKGRVVLRGDI